MVFWIVLGLVIVIAIGVCIYNSVDYDIEEGLFTGFIALLIGGIVGGAILLITFIIAGGVGTESETSSEKDVSTYQLRTIGGGETYEGKYYLAGQVVDGERYYVYMYVQPGEDENSNTVHLEGRAVDEVTVNEENTKEPYLKITKGTEVHNDWLFPWRVTTTTKAEKVEFFVPVDSILTDYSLLGTDEETQEW